MRWTQPWRPKGKLPYSQLQVMKGEIIENLIKNKRHHQIMFLFLFIFSKFQFKIPCVGEVICGKKLQLPFKREKNFRLRKLRL